MNAKVVLKDEERQPCEIWTRVMGYFRPIQNYNIGKRAEYKERQFFTESKACAGSENEKEKKKDYKKRTSVCNHLQTEVL